MSQEGDYDLKWMSPSVMSHFKSCPFDWKGARLGLPMVKTDRRHLDFGGIAHELIARYYRIIDNTTSYKERVRTIDTLFGDNPLINAIENLKTKTDAVIKGFKKFERMRDSHFPIFRPTLLEERLIAGRYKCFGDFYCQEGKFAIDWKTARLTELGESNYIQSAVVNYCLNSNGYINEKFYFVGLIGPTILESPVMTKGWIDKIADEMLDMINRDYYPKRPHRYCYSCGSSLRCEFDGWVQWDLD